MNIELIKKEVLTNLCELKQECEFLLKRIDEYTEEILKIQTEEEAKIFDETHDIEEGLKIIQLFI